ncbi:hypothetical protein OKW46_005231 [Paraburkholderia sp. WSM4179]|nr:hypothetical protein [Paraburkholderia sp. WSM4179]
MCAATLASTASAPSVSRIMGHTISLLRYPLPPNVF